MTTKEIAEVVAEMRKTAVNWNGTLMGTFLIDWATRLEQAMAGCGDEPMQSMVWPIMAMMTGHVHRDPAPHAANNAPSPSVTLTATPQTKVPEGFVLVPMEITNKMQHAYFDVIDKNMNRVQTDCLFGWYESQKQAYRAMLAAVPTEESRMSEMPNDFRPCDLETLCTDLRSLGKDGWICAEVAAGHLEWQQSEIQRLSFAQRAMPVEFIDELTRVLMEVNAWKTDEYKALRAFLTTTGEKG